MLGDDPWGAQVGIAESVRDHRETAVKSCHGIGKSFTAARVALWFALTHDPAIVITTAPTDRQVRGILWKEIRLAHQRARVPLGGRLLTQELRWADDRWIWGFTAPEHDPDRFQGFHESNVLVIVDEACGVSQQIQEAIDGVLSGGNARKLEIGNPTDPASPFAKSFRTPGVSKLSIPAFETPNFTAFGITEGDIASGAWEAKLGDEALPAPHLVRPQWVADRYRRWGPESPLYLARVKAQFPEQSSDTLIPFAWIERAQLADFEPKETDEIKPAHELGVDVARFGDDETVAYRRQGRFVRLCLRGRGWDTMRTAGEVMRIIRETGASAKVDEIGIGAGVIDRLKEQRVAAIGINVADAASDSERFANLRAEMFWGLRERFEQGDIDIDPEDEELAAQLAALRYKVDSRGRILMEAKEEMKRRLPEIGSPDRADAIAIAFTAGGRSRAIQQRAPVIL